MQDTQDTYTDRIADIEDFMTANRLYRGCQSVEWFDEGDLAVREKDESDDRLESMNDSWMDSVSER